MVFIVSGKLNLHDNGFERRLTRQTDMIDFLISADRNYQPVIWPKAIGNRFFNGSEMTIFIPQNGVLLNAISFRF